MTFLLEVNMLLALIDPTNGSLDAALVWFEREGQRSWATCPLTESSVLGIIGNPKFSNSPDSPAIVAASSSRRAGVTGRVFKGDMISLFSGSYTDVSQVLTSARVTDTYLLSLATAQGGKLAMFDLRLSAKAMKAGKAALHVVADRR